MVLRRGEGSGEWNRGLMLFNGCLESTILHDSQYMNPKKRSEESIYKFKMIFEEGKGESNVAFACSTFSCDSSE